MSVVVVVGRESQYVAPIKKLWRANSDTLGFLPDGAFDDYFRLKHVLAAIDDAGRFLGYLLFRITREKATIAHLCIAEEHQGKGYAALLVRHLIESTKHLRGIDLRCRRDFPVYTLWPKLGFCARDELAGRSAEGHSLTNFWLDHGHPDLFSSYSENSRWDVALDSSVFIDIVDPAQVRNEESHALLADWLQGSIRLAVTEELFNDIDRQRDPRERRQRRIGYTGGAAVETELGLFSEDGETLRLLLVCTSRTLGSLRNQGDDRPAKTLLNDGQQFVGTVGIIYDADGGRVPPNLHPCTLLARAE